MKEYLNNIIKYCKFLKENFNYDIFIYLKPQLSSDIFYANDEFASTVNCHYNPYCMAVKTILNQQDRCSECQRHIMNMCRSTPYYINKCHAGVKEFIFGIYIDGEAVGFLSLNGYRDSDFTYPLSQSYYLKNLPNDEQLVDTVIRPLLCMFENHIESTFSAVRDETVPTLLYKRIVNFLRDNHIGVTTSMLAEKFHYSSSHISHLFKQNSGMSVNEYCNKLKLNDAQKLICNTSLTVTEIAHTLGFSDVSSFISMFKKFYKTTPLAMRKQTLNSQKQ